MKAVSKYGLVVAAVVAALGIANAANASVEKFFVEGNITTCQQVFDALETQHPIEFPAGSFGFVNAEIPVGSLTTGEFAETSGIDGVIQTINITSVAADGTSFDWVESTDPALGFDAISIKAGNGRSIYVLSPDGTSGENYADLNTTQKINSALFCADDNVTIADGGALCDLPSSTLGELCDAAGSTSVVEIFVPGSGTTQICACPGVVFNVCNPDPVCDPETEDCSGSFCDPNQEQCCLIHPLSGNTLTLQGVPKGTTSTPVSGSQFCSVSTTTSGGGGTSSFQFCFR